MKVLGIFAHCDDESFGCLQTLLKHKKEGDEFYFQWFTYARETRKGMMEVISHFATSYTESYYGDQKLDTADFREITQTIERTVQFFKPDIVYTNFIGDLNRDHRIIAEAVQVACRPYKEWAPKEVWMSAIPSTTELGLRPIRKDMLVEVKPEKEKLIRQWYPDEMINGREVLPKWEVFEKWPRI